LSKQQAKTFGARQTVPSGVERLQCGESSAELYDLSDNAHARRTGCLSDGADLHEVVGKDENDAQ
jgi:hypothetical protein